jgi:glyoxylase-like metal-dependent hydrolase (beta-lactamase superfamily II)
MRPFIGAGVLLLIAVGPGSVFAQVDLSGEWSARYHEDQEHRIPGPELGDYTGLPINDAARLKADSWDASILSLREHQAKPHPSTYSLRGPANIRITKAFDPVTQDTIAYELFGTFGQATRMIWLDGRPHPSGYAAHTWAGFSTGRWEGDTLTVTTTHFKVGWIQRNGVAHSDAATMTEHFMRHGDVLTVVTIVDDPVYFEEPFIRSSNWVLNATQEVNRTQFDVVDEVAGHPKGNVPHYLPGSAGARLKLTEFATKHGIPVEAVRGGAETIYPEYQLRLQQLMSRGNSTSNVPAPTRASSTNSFRPRPPAPPNPRGGDQVRLVPVQGNIHMLVGAGANIAVQIGDEGVLLIDTGARGLSDSVLAAIRQVTDKPIRILVDSSVDEDHAGGNEEIAKVGRWLGGNAPGNFGLAVTGARVLAHERVLARMSAPTGKLPARPFAAWPTETFFTADKEIFFNNEAIQLLHQPAAHTDGDVVVFFRRSDVVAAGDVFITTGYPVIDRTRGGSVQGLIDGLNRIIDVTIPKDKEEGGTYVIPGHGRLADEADVVEYRDMVTIVRDRIQDLIRRGLTLDQVKAARPTLDYDGRYGSSDAFIEAVYRDLTRG